MSATQHTPGPWLKAATGNVLDGRGCKVCTVEPLPGMDNREKETNARLIAAAPDLLAASVSALALLAQIDAICIDGKLPALGVIRELARDAAGPMRNAIARATGAEWEGAK